MPHFSSEGPQTLFSLPLPFSPLSGGICCFIRAWRSHQSTYFILQMRSEAGQLPGFCRKERPGVTLPCGLLTSVSLFLLFSSPPHPGCLWAQRLGRSEAYLRGHPAVYGGWDILYKSPPPLISTVTNEDSLLTSTDEQPRAGLWSLSGANDTNSGSLNRAHACFYYRYPWM